MWVYGKNTNLLFSHLITYKPHTNPIPNQVKAHAKVIFHIRVIQSSNEKTRGIYSLICHFLPIKHREKSKINEGRQKITLTLLEQLLYAPM